MPTLEQARRWYDAADPVHGFDHVSRVLATALKVGAEEGADLEIIQAAALLHDVSGATPSEDRANHEQNSAQFAREILTAEGWRDDRIEAVEHCIRSHRYRGSAVPRTLEAKVMFDADKLDVIGAFGIARTLGYAIQAGQPAYAPISEKFSREGKLQSGEPHSAYHEYQFKLRKVQQRLHTDAARRLADQREGLLHAFFNQLKQEAEGTI